jgi:xanthine dehydrogenase accessory factor
LATRDLRYLGLIGSKAKVTRLHDVLREEGIAVEHPDRLHAPVGLDIGAISPEEIAVSILAELIAVKYGKLESAEGTMDSGVKALRWTPTVKETTPVAADS